MTHKRSPHPDLLVLVERAWQECGTIEKTAYWLGVSTATARNWLSDLGLVPRAARRRFRSKLSSKQAAEIRALLEQGVSPPDLAKKFGVSLTTISQIKHRRTHKPEP